MRTFAAFAAAFGIALAAAALAQGPGAGELRPEPPAPPARNPAARGEPPAGLAPVVPGSGAPTANRNRRAENRCGELIGAMREQCLLQHQGSGAGATSVPEPRTAPPPQNPR